jgi:hypothetical protein
MENNIKESFDDFYKRTMLYGHDGEHDYWEKEVALKIFSELESLRKENAHMKQTIRGMESIIGIKESDIESRKRDEIKLIERAKKAETERDFFYNQVEVNKNYFLERIDVYDERIKQVKSELAISKETTEAAVKGFNQALKDKSELVEALKKIWDLASAGCYNKYPDYDKNDASRRNHSNLDNAIDLINKHTNENRD